MIKNVKGAAAKMHRDHPSRWGYVPPWLLPFALLAAGSVMHDKLAHPEWALPVTVLFLYTATAGVSVMTWLYARPRGLVIQWHSVVTAMAGGLTLVLTAIFGPHPGLVWPAIGVGVAFAATWNIRRLEVIRGEGNDAHNKDVLAELGLTVKKAQVVTNTKDRKEIKLKMGDGQTVETVQKQLGALGSHAGALRKGTTAVPGEREGEVTLSFEFTDVLKETLPWPGPTHPGGSIADGLHFGLYRDRAPMWIYPAGNYAKNIAPGVTAIGGISRAGKDVTAEVLIAEMSTRVDVVNTLSDTRKGDQFLADVRAAIKLYFDTDNGVRAYLKALERAGMDRNKALGAAGYKKWEPRCYTDKVTPNGQPGLKMPAVAAWLLESAAVLDNNATLIVELGEFLNSSGIMLFLSQQRWTHDRAPTSLRSNVGNALCFGTGDAADAGCILSDATLQAGPDPFEWKARYPGRLLVEGNGIEPERFPVPGKGFFGGELARQTIAEWGPRMAELDPITAKAFGEKILACTPPASTAVAIRPDAEVELDDDDRPYQPTDEEEAQFMVPKMDDPELAAMSAKVDPRSDMPAWEGEDVNLEPEPLPGDREWTPAEKRAEFGRMLEALMHANKVEVSTGELTEEWAGRVGESQTLRRWFLHELIGEWIELGQMERIGHGKYRLLTLASVGSAGDAS